MTEKASGSPGTLRIHTPKEGRKVLKTANHLRSLEGPLVCIESCCSDL